MVIMILILIKMTMTAVIISEFSIWDETISTCLFASFNLARHVVVLVYYVFHHILKKLFFSLLCFSFHFKKVVSTN